MLSLQFGLSTVAAVVTVSAFMLGLAGGSALMARRAARAARPLRLLAMLETAIAAFALLVPWIERHATPLLDAAARSLSFGQWHGLMALAGLLTLTLPAAVMGAGFPLLVESWARRGHGIAAAYGSNTAGGALGALLPLLLLPSVGWMSAVRVVAALNLLAAAGFFALDRAGPSSAVPRPASAALRAPSAALLAGYGVIGAASLLLEMAWLRLFSLAMLRTEYVLALILAVMLLGIGVGSLQAARRLSPRVLAALPWWASGYALIGLWLLPTVSGWLEWMRFDSLAEALVVQGLLLAALTLPVTLSLGLWLPALAVDRKTDGTLLYAANALGAALGALLYVILTPLIGSAGALAVAAVLLLLPGLALARSRRAWAAVPLVVAVAVMAAHLPPVSAFLPRSMAGSHDLYRYEDAIAITQVTEQADGQRVLLTDLRRQDASTEPTAVFLQANQARLPLLLHPHPRSVLFLGLGTGISITGALPFPDLERSAVELSAGSIEAARRFFVESNQGALEGTKVYHDDARHFLSAAARRYDVIVGDVFHPDLAGAGSLLSVEQFERVRACLEAQGLYVQWLALNQFDVRTLGVVLRSFRQVFPHAQLFLDGLHLALVGPRDEWQGAAALQMQLSALAPAQRAAVTGFEGDSEWLGRYWGPIVPSAGPEQHEWAPVIEFLLPRLHYDRHLDITSVMQWLESVRPAAENAVELLRIAPTGEDEFKRAYTATGLRVRSELADGRGATLEADYLLGRALATDPHDRWVMYAVADRLLASLEGARAHGLSEEELLHRILTLNPWSVEAWRALWKWQRAHGDAGAEASRARLLELCPLDREARASGR